ncbi:MAG: hypothetical protein JJ900_08815 [Rhodospirillales bacterium]|nr:hypothetical protein [Rhodospirillales bacterium]MBO6786940.1 hypothetical protein [Rhodospirillales bacterium]
MIAKLKKLEATDGSAVNAMALDFDKPQAKTQKPTVPSPELQMLSVPRDGWLSGPGRRFNCA